jgi:hypothetical protein
LRGLRRGEEPRKSRIEKGPSGCASSRPVLPPTGAGGEQGYSQIWGRNAPTRFQGFLRKPKAALRSRDETDKLL